MYCFCIFVFFFFFFFFQAEDGIRDYKVTGVQTCALPICINVLELRVIPGVERLKAQLEAAATGFAERKVLEEGHVPVVAARPAQGVEIGRASCRERVERWVGGGTRKKKKKKRGARSGENI